MREMALVMPKLSMTMEDGQVLAWHKNEGDVIRTGDIVCEVMTDKVNMDVESTVDGTLTRIVVQQGTSVQVGEPMAYIATESDDLFEGLTVGPQPTVAASEVPTATASPDPVATGTDQVASPPSRKGPIAAAPLARRRAAELGIDLASVRGSGVGGAITKNDVEKAARAKSEPAPTKQPPAPAQTARTTQPAAPAQPANDGSEFADALDAHRRAVRLAVARKMTESAAIPQFTAYTDLDLHLLSLTRGRVGWTPLLIHATAATVRNHPLINSVWHDGEPTPADHVGIALAIDTPVGLVAPVLIDPDLMTLDELTTHTRQLIERARNGKLGGDALAGATFTVSNLGGFGVRVFQALVTPPQVAALSIGAVGEFPVGVNGALAVRTTCTVGLTVDHRAADGADAGRFLSDLQSSIASTQQLLQHGGRSV
jgi:pyruvate dehydrogenase E2 component (dihydrolipoamide acetyltransferase)